MSVTYREFTRLSLNGEGELFCRSWVPDSPRAVIQIAHGMCEHSGRYQRLGNLLAENGFAVYMNDHAGHGRSAMGHPGTFSDGDYGFTFVMGDMRSLFDTAEAECPDLPHVLIGHSMGSILSGLCADHWGKDLRGLILLGTPSPNRFAWLAGLLSHAFSRRKGPEYQSDFLHRITSGATSGAGLPPVVRKRWLSHNMKNILAYMNDPLAGFEFSASAIAELADGLDEFGSRSWGKHIPKTLPVLIMGGDEDRGGGYGTAPKYYAEHLRELGLHDVTLHIVQGARHEIFNEINTLDADATLLDWLCTRFPDKRISV